MGMILTCPRDALPGEAAAFLILDYELNVTAVSEAGERFFGKEKAVIGSTLLDLVTSPLGDDQLVRKASVAAQRPCDPIVMPVRLLGPSSRQRWHDGGADRHLRTAAGGPPHRRAERVRPSLSVATGLGRNSCARTTARVAQHLARGQKLPSSCSLSPKTYARSHGRPNRWG